MSDKDQFTFDDDDDFPETDLSAAFSDGEHEAENPAPEVQEEPEPKKKAKKDKMTSSGGGSRTRILLVILLLVVGGGAGAYYFMDLGGTTPSVPTASVPAQKAQKSVALPPKPANTPAPTAKPEPASTPVKVAVPPPPPAAKAVTQQAAAPVEKAAPDKQPVKVPTTHPAPATKPAEQEVAEEARQQPVAKPAAKVAVPVPSPQPKPEVKSVVVEEKPTPKPAPAPVVVAKAATLPSKPVIAPKQVAGGAFALDAGSFLFESNRNSLIEKIRMLGYEPLVTPVDATLDMTRLRLGTFAKDEVKDALDFARSIEPGSYSAPAGDNYVIYAGTFLSKGNIDKLTKRFQSEGIKVYPEPVQVVRTLSRIRFGSFASREDASTAAAVVSESGIKAVVVKSK